MLMLQAYVNPLRCSLYMENDRLPHQHAKRQDCSERVELTL